MTDQKTKCGFVSVVGLPNAGKSTLINALVGAKVSIVSRKVQTTRSRILGIALNGAAQIILIDTPGIFKAKKTLEKAMVTAALSSFEETDYVAHIIDVNIKDPVSSNKIILNALAEQNIPKEKTILILNKIDRISKPCLLYTSDAADE